MINLANYHIEVTEDVLNTLETFKQDSFKIHEAGGILLGYIVKEEAYIRITKVSTPCKYDKSTPTSFDRDANNAQKIINKEFDESQGKIIYLGEWHTHFQKVPMPSSIDINMIKKQYKVSTLNANILLLLIKGTENLYISVYDGKKFVSDYLN